MRFQNLLDANTIQLKMQAGSKQEALWQMYRMLYQAGCIRSIARFADAVQEREKHGMTGIGGMLAIPHGCSETVVRSRVAIARLVHPIQWETVDCQPVRVLLLFAIAPGDSEVQLQAMAAMARFLGQEEYKRRLLNCRSVRGLCRLLQEMPEGEMGVGLHLVAVTACPAGVAHTYISRECLIQGATARHHSIKVETQGAVGVENRLTPVEIREADVVIIAADIEIEQPERFEGKRIVRVPVSVAIHSADELVARIEERLNACRKEWV